MRFSIYTLLLLLALGIAGCAPVQTIDPELRRQAAAIHIVAPEDVGDRQYTILSEVLGVSCAVQAGSDPSLEGARADMRVSAARHGADAIINAFCEEGGVDLRRNCWKKIECRGDAVQWRE